MRSTASFPPPTSVGSASLHAVLIAGAIHYVFIQIDAASITAVAVTLHYLAGLLAREEIYGSRKLFARRMARKRARPESRAFPAPRDSLLRCACTLSGIRNIYLCLATFTMSLMYREMLPDCWRASFSLFRPLTRTIHFKIQTLYTVELKNHLEHYAYIEKWV